MATFSAVRREHVLQAIEECDRRGPDDFLGVYGFVADEAFVLLHEGRRYDCEAVVGVAHRFATGRLASPQEFHGGPQDAADLLRRRGFEVETPAASPAPAGRPARASATRPARTTRTARAAAPRRAAVPEPVVAVCPTCFMTLPATGVCDQCG